MSEDRAKSPAPAGDFYREDIVSRICSVESCEKRSKARGWCGAHYMRWHRHGDPLWTAPPRPTPSHTEVMAEMREALDRAREVTS